MGGAVLRPRLFKSDRPVNSSLHPRRYGNSVTRSLNPNKLFYFLFNNIQPNTFKNIIQKYIFYLFGWRSIVVLQFAHQDDTSCNPEDDIYSHDGGL